jgi:hypothetical protein
VEDQPVVGISPKRLRDNLFKLNFDLVHGFTGREARPVGDPENMRVDRKGFLAECGVQNDVCGFAPNARQ